MATSGTELFTLSRDEIIAAALRTMEVIGAGETPTAEDLTNCGQALNLLCKAYANKGMPLWVVKELTVPLVANQAQYPLGPAGGTIRPLRVLQAWLHNNSSTLDTPLMQVSHSDYGDLGSKGQLALPNQFYYDPQLVNGLLTLYGVPYSASSSLRLIVQRQVQDINLGTENPDFPQEAFQMLKWMLIDELSLEYGAKMNVIQIAAGKAKFYQDEFQDANAEQGSYYFLPSGRTC